VNAVTVKRGENATLRSTSKAWSESERAAVERTVLGFYDIFLARVAEGRGMSKAEVEAVAGGRVWTGREALERRLVDRLGSLADAVAIAAERANAGGDEGVTIRRYEASRGLFGSLPGAAARADTLGALAERVPEIAAAALIAEIDGPAALPVEWISDGSLGASEAR
jgi:protease-4